MDCLWVIKVVTRLPVCRCSAPQVKILAAIRAVTAYETASDHQLNRAACCFPTLQSHRSTWECSNTVSSPTPPQVPGTFLLMHMGLAAHLHSWLLRTRSLTPHSASEPSWPKAQR